jgi:hypothetical protein
VLDVQSRWEQRRDTLSVLRLYALPDGRSALLRFWDPRVLVNLARTLDGAQREEFFGHIHEWHLLDAGRRMWIGRQHAEAH